MTRKQYIYEIYYTSKFLGCNMSFIILHTINTAQISLSTNISDFTSGKVWF
jgi:hypothetical protein